MRRVLAIAGGMLAALAVGWIAGRLGRVPQTMEPTPSAGWDGTQVYARPEWRQAMAVGWIAGRFGRIPQTLEPMPPAGWNLGDVSSVRSLYLMPGFRADELEALRERFGTSMSLIDFEGKTFWLVMKNYGYGVPYTAIGLYAPNKEAAFTLCLEADSCGAGFLKTELDPNTGILQLREHARSPLEGKVILACNLRSVGTYQSVHGK